MTGLVYGDVLFSYHLCYPPVFSFVLLVPIGVSLVKES